MPDIPRVMTLVAVVARCVTLETAIVANSENDSVAMKLASSAVAKAYAFQVVTCATSWMLSARSLRLSGVAAIATIPIAVALAVGSRRRVEEGRGSAAVLALGCLRVFGKVVIVAVVIGSGSSGSVARAG